MPKTQLEEESQWKLPDETPLPAVLVKVTTRVIDYIDKKTQEAASFEKWEWEFSITGGDYAGLSAWGETEDRMTTLPGNKVRQWAETLRGKEFSLGEGLDTDDLLGLKCVITVSHEVQKKKDGEDFYKCPVADVFPDGSISGDPWAADPPF